MTEPTDADIMAEFNTRSELAYHASVRGPNYPVIVKETAKALGVSVDRVREAVLSDSSKQGAG